MSHWYRPPRAASVGSLLRRLPNDFLVDERVSDRALPLLMGKVRDSKVLGLDQETPHEDVIRRCQQEQLILVTTDLTYEAFLRECTNESWGVLILPDEEASQISVLRRLSMGQLVFSRVNKKKFRIDHVRRNNLLVNLRLNPPTVRVLNNPAGCRIAVSPVVEPATEAKFASVRITTMPDYLPITLRAVDNEGQIRFEYSVPFDFGISVKQLLERAFVLAQTSAKADPFVYTIEYFGYSQSSQFPGYLGYEIESIAELPNNAQFYWDLLLDGVSASSGADTTYPNPGGTVLWQYTAIPAEPSALPPRTATIQSRRSTRS
jgi:hypothetical protein